MWPSDNIYHHRFGSTLPQVMACCLIAPSHNLNPMLTYHHRGPMTFIWWLFHNRYRLYIQPSTTDIGFSENSLKNPRGQWVKWWYMYNDLILIICSCLFVFLCIYLVVCIGLLYFISWLWYCISDCFSRSPASAVFLVMLQWPTYGHGGRKYVCAMRHSPA